MKLLIVDCFTSTKHGRERFTDFKTTIEGALRGPYYKYLPEIGIAVRSGKDLRDFIFDVDGLFQDGQYNDASALRAFQNLDMVFIGGDDTTILPWSETAKPLRMLLKQCFSYSVPTFACGFPSHFVVYMVHLNGQSIRVFNGRGRGGTKQELRDLPTKIRNKISVQDSFLDGETGDYYQKEEFSVFSLRGNVGIFNALRKQATNVYKTRPSTVPSNDPDPTRNDEVVVELATARFQHHWLFQDIQKQRFLAQTSATWKLHDKINPRMVVYLVSRPNAMPELICLDQTIYGMQFLVSRKYPETAQILWNWTTRFCEEIRKCPGRRIGSVGADILNPMIFTNDVTGIWDEQLDEEYFVRKQQKKKMLEGVNEADDDDDNIHHIPAPGVPSGAPTYPRRSFNASRSQWDDDFFNELTNSLEQLRNANGFNGTANNNNMAPSSAGTKIGSRVPTGASKMGGSRGGIGSGSGPSGGPGANKATTSYTDDFRSLFHGGSTWPDAGEGGGGAGGGGPSRGGIRSHNGGEFGFGLGMGANGNMTIAQTLETHEIPLTNNTRTFSKVEIRKMLHPEADITDIAPYTPRKTVRVNTVKKPYTRWRYFEELEMMERYNQNPQLWCKTLGFTSGFGAGGEICGSGSRPHTEQGMMRRNIDSRMQSRGSANSGGGAGVNWRNEKLSADQRRPRSVPHNLHSPTAAMRGPNGEPSVRDGVYPPTIYDRQAVKPSSSSTTNQSQYVQHLPIYGASVLEKSRGTLDIDQYGNITSKPLTAPGGPFKRPRGLKTPDVRPPFVPHVSSSGRSFKHVPNYVNKTPGPLLTEHTFRDASNVGGDLKDFLPVGAATGGWEKAAITGFPASQKAYLENEKNMMNHALDFRNAKSR